MGKRFIIIHMAIQRAKCLPIKQSETRTTFFSFCKRGLPQKCFVLCFVLINRILLNHCVWILSPHSSKNIGPENFSKSLFDFFVHQLLCPLLCFLLLLLSLLLTPKEDHFCRKHFCLTVSLCFVALVSTFP